MKLSRRAWLVLLLTSVSFMSNVSRGIFSPLLVSIKNELDFSQSRAGSLFLIIALGYSPGMLFSGFLTTRIRHTGTIFLSLFLEAAGLFLAALSGSFGFMAFGLVLVGIGSGIYPPSGNASINAVIKQEKKGLALAIHEMGPNFGLFACPLIVLALYDLVRWRGILLVIAGVNLFVALIYARRGFGGEARGQSPRFGRIKTVLKLPEVWILFALECIGLSAIQGVFAILPMFLVTARHLDSDFVNTLVSVSRLSCIAMLLVSGILINAIGARAVILLCFAVSGVATLFLGITTGAALVVFVVIQPALMAAIFPAILLILSGVGPPESWNVTFSLIVSAAVFFSNGVVPAFFGWLGDMGMLPAGFAGLAAVILACFFLVCFRRSFGADSRRTAV